MVILVLVRLLRPSMTVCTTRMASCKGPIFQVERMILVEGSLHVIKSVHAIGQ